MRRIMSVGVGLRARFHSYMRLCNFMAVVKPRLVSDMGDFTLVFPLLVKEQRHASPFSL